MKQKTSLIAAGFLTLLVVAAILGVSFLSQALAQEGQPSTTHTSPVAPPPTAETAEPAPAATATAQVYDEAVQSYRRQASDMEQQYQEQINSLRDALQSLDAEYGAQLQSLKEQLATADATVAALDEKTAATNASIAQLQHSIQVADETYQTDLDTMVSNAQQQEMAMRAEAETLYAGLQAAYDEIAARQAAAAAASSQSGGDNNNGNNRQHDDDDRGGEHHEERDEEHDDD